MAINFSVSDHFPEYCTPRGILIRGDSLQVLKEIPDHSIALILTDPPYHSTGKRNIYGDTAFKEDNHYLDWMALYAEEWKRVLKPNGSLFCFCSSKMAGRLESVFNKEFNILSQIVWTKPNNPGFDGWKQKMNKESLRQWYDHSERIIFAEPAAEGNLRRSPFGNYLRECRIQCNLSAKDVAEMIGAYGKINHGGSVANWEAGRNIPNREQYQKIKKAFMQAGNIDMPDYENAIRPFFVDKKKEFTDIWTFANIRPYKGKHPAEKPIALLEHAISATTYTNDIVLDCFAGSGSTAVAAMKLGRLSISIEIDENWAQKIETLLEVIAGNNYTVFPDNYSRGGLSINLGQKKLF